MLKNGFKFSYFYIENYVTCDVIFDVAKGPTNFLT